MICKVMDIRGDYATIRFLDTGIETDVALALLPDFIDIGNTLKFENYTYEIVESH